jgi:hypothetical protein
MHSYGVLNVINFSSRGCFKPCGSGLRSPERMRQRCGRQRKRVRRADIENYGLRYLPPATVLNGFQYNDGVTFRILGSVRVQH